MKIFIILLLSMVLAILPAGCSEESTDLVSPSDILYSKDILYVDSGAAFSIVKKADACSPCLWEFVQSFEEGYLELQEYTVVNTTNPDPETIGGSVTQTWLFRAKEQGTIDCTLGYSCPWLDRPQSYNKIIVIIE